MKMFRIVVTLFLCLVAITGMTQTPPRLVVGIMVDQMQQDYLYRFESTFGENGFRRFTRDGFQLLNAHYNYVPTETGPGHASVYTGSTPAIHGIVGNDWYDRHSKKIVYCVSDPDQKPVGTDVGGSFSPRLLLSTTITDELKLSTQQKGKVISVSIKDRSSVLPAGHMPDGAYWYDNKTGNLITSTYYLQQLPEWVKKFNDRKLPNQYLNLEWTPLLPVDRLASGPDDNPYEGKFRGKDKPVFPYKLAELRKTMGEYALLPGTPWGNTLVAEFAKAAVTAEGLGKDTITDFLAISFSSPDLIGHMFGPNAAEVADTYLRLDKTLEDLFATLDKEVGKGAYTVFISSDHGVAEVPQRMVDLRVPAGYFRPALVQESLIAHLEKYFPGKKIVELVTSDQVYINQQAFEGDPRATGVDFLVVSELITNFLLTTEGIAQVYPSSVLRQAAYGEEGLRGKVIRGYYPRRCGDIAFVLEPGWLAWGGVTGSTHGSGYSYDTHVPVMFYGAGIRKGSSSRYHAITDIAPTLAVLMKTKFPNGATGQPVSEMLDEQ
jgi:predicted AlkP superfamily pyrophosphatase or phosphodiesterase